MKKTLTGKDISLFSAGEEARLCFLAIFGFINYKFL